MPRLTWVPSGPDEGMKARAGILRLSVWRSSVDGRPSNPPDWNWIVIVADAADEHAEWPLAVSRCGDDLIPTPIAAQERAEAAALAIRDAITAAFGGS